MLNAFFLPFPHQLEKPLSRILLPGPWRNLLKYGLCLQLKQLRPEETGALLLACKNQEESCDCA
jgi:hypothetical protein